MESLRRETGPRVVDPSAAPDSGLSVLDFSDARGGADRVLCLEGRDIRVDCVNDLDERVFRGNEGADKIFFSSSSSSLMPSFRFKDLTGDALGEWMYLSRPPLNDRGASSSAMSFSSSTGGLSNYNS